MIESQNRSEKLPHIDFLIFTAIPDEQEALLDALGEYRAFNFGDSGIGTLHHIQSKTGDIYDVVLVTLSSVGNVESGIQSSLAINALQPNYLIMAGIAGGIKGKTCKGDILVADQIIYYSQSKRTPDGNEIRPQGLAVDPYLLQVAKTCLDIDWGQLRAEDHFKQNSNTPNIHFGPILVGEEVVADTDYIKQLLKLNPKIIGVEMESYGAGRAALFPRQRIRFITFRSVSDFADETKDDSWHKTACAAVAAYTVFFIKSGLVEKVPGKSRKVAGDNIILHHFSQQLLPQEPVVESVNAIDANSRLFHVSLPQYKLFKDGLPIDLDSVQNANISAVKKVEKLLIKHPDATLFYFGIAYIPLLFHLGFLLSNKRRLNFFEFDRYSQIWIPLNEEGDSSSLEVEGLPTKKTRR